MTAVNETANLPIVHTNSRLALWSWPHLHMCGDLAAHARRHSTTTLRSRIEIITLICNKASVTIATCSNLLFKLHVRATTWHIPNYD